MADFEVETNYPTRAVRVEEFASYPAALARTHQVLDAIEARRSAYDVITRRKREWWVKLYRVEGQERRRVQVGQWTRGRQHRAVGQARRGHAAAPHRHRHGGR